MAATPSAGVEALHRLKLTEPPMYLTQSPELANDARIASEYLFASLKPYAPKSPFDRLLVDDKFDAEQIWQQIDLQSQPLISAIRRQVNKFEKDPQELKDIFKSGDSDQEKEKKKKKELVLEAEKEEEEEEDDDEDELDDESDEEEEEDEDEMEEDEGEDRVGVEDKFLNIEEMKEFMEDDEAREYGVDRKKKVVKKMATKFGEDDAEDEDEMKKKKKKMMMMMMSSFSFNLCLKLGNAALIGMLDLAGDEDDSDAEDARYEDFFTSTKKRGESKKPKVDEKVKDIDVSDEEETEDSDKGDEEDDGMESDDEIKTENLSTHEKQLLEQRAKIEQVERENLEAKSWTMQGEVNATKRPKNSALEVDLDWERNAKPPPVITEEVSQSIEELIMKRIAEGQFDDVQKAPSLPSKAPREMKELDENQSKKGLGELYADEYAQKTGLVSQALSFSDEQKKEASLLFKKLCLKLDALSHFHFTPKPVIEDMSIQTNVPALAMEEVSTLLETSHIIHNAAFMILLATYLSLFSSWMQIAPLAVSDAAMLAPEEVFSGKGDIKEEAELTQEDRKRRRAHKKRKFKAENAKRMAKKPRESTQAASDGEYHLSFI
ncbi:hypothetical protein OSB04_004239 [Centaurea solstitialis]|uniref:U3 small nucleolar ribonucleoprotein protein MPP10 n=1 Tax=Centaurea solstitialis TaxID=347529 RepID=A0AA38TWF6_9ASTR|nr:hypothetical protein OSB04_004239 [Centaurea solstitialis]